MDFQVPAPGGVGPGQPAALTARGADPAIYIPAGSHFFRRVTGLVLQPVPGALVATPTTLSLSIIELVLGPALAHNGVAAVQSLDFFTTGFHPTKYEQALAQLEAEPAGVGLNPLQQYRSLEHAAAAVLAAVSRVAQQVGPLSPAYVLSVADTFQLEPLGAGVAAAFGDLVTGVNALKLSHLTATSSFFQHLGWVAFMTFGRSLSASRDAPAAPSRRFALQLGGLCATVGYLPGGAASSLTSEATRRWLEFTTPNDHIVFVYSSIALDSREQNLRDRHNLVFGSSDQKASISASLVLVEPLASLLPDLARVLGAGLSISEVLAACQRLARLVHMSRTAHAQR
jgi:hypothetical protein